MSQIRKEFEMMTLSLYQKLNEERAHIEHHLNDLIDFTDSILKEER